LPKLRLRILWFTSEDLRSPGAQREENPAEIHGS
jgi:hypothetical protein